MTLPTPTETFAAKVLDFYRQIRLRAKLPRDVEVMNPYRDTETFAVTRLFYEQYYNDNNEREIILGINPGRFGGGITGVPFTDPINIETRCGIKNDFQKKPELSSTFIYMMIDVFGGPEQFYNRYFISALSPLGFVMNGKNLNYYDIKELHTAAEPFILESIRKQLTFGISRKRCFCLGEGENFKYLQKVNEQQNFFAEIIPLPHPRFIMQYRRKQLNAYIDRYVRDLRN